MLKLEGGIDYRFAGETVAQIGNLYVFTLGRDIAQDIALRCPRRVQRRNSFDWQCCSDTRSACYYSGEDGASLYT